MAYYRHTIERMLLTVAVAVCHVSTADFRQYLSAYQADKGSCKVTIDNMRRIFSSFFAWLEDEDYIAKSPARRLHKGMPIEQVQRLLGHVRIERTLQYAIVNQNNVKMAHKEYLG